MSKIEDVRQAVREADDWQVAVDINAQRMASLIQGRLQSSGVNWSDLCSLKKELARYNMHTMEWKE